MVKPLKSNYAKNVAIIKENLKRGMDPGDATSVINQWRSQFVAHDLYGDDEKEFINQALEAVSEYTHIKVVEM